MEGVDDLLGDPLSGGEVLLAVGGTQLLGALPGDEHLVVCGIGLDRRGEPCPLLLGEVLGPGAEVGLDPVERVALVPTMPGCVLLNAAVDLIDRGGAEFDDRERVEHRDGVLELVVDCGPVAGERVQHGDLHASAERVAALTEPGGVGLPRSAQHQVQQPHARPPTIVADQVDHPGQILRAVLSWGAR